MAQQQPPGQYLELPRRPPAVGLHLEVIASELTGTGHLRIWLRSVPPQGQHTFFIVTLDAIYRWVPAEPVPEPVD